jgi:hypothetical protein
MFLGEDVLPGVSFRSAQAEPADLTVGGWVSSVPGGSYDGGLAGLGDHDIPVHLRRVLGGLDRRNVALVTAANGQPSPERRTR